jgi:hypothetical protein
VGVGVHLLVLLRLSLLVDSLAIHGLRHTPDLVSRGLGLVGWWLIFGVRLERRGCLDWGPGTLLRVATLLLLVINWLLRDRAGGSRHVPLHVLLVLL